MIDVTINLICTQRPGTLSRLIRDIKQFGLIYSSHNIESRDGKNLISVHGTGELNCHKEKLIALLSALPEVISIIDITIIRDGIELDQIETQVSSELIKSNELLTPAILSTAEKRLSETLGPIASYLVETSAQTSRDTGELFHSLALELNTEVERQDFLSIIE